MGRNNYQPVLVPFVIRNGNAPLRCKHAAEGETIKRKKNETKIIRGFQKSGPEAWTLVKVSRHLRKGPPNTRSVGESGMTVHRSSVIHSVITDEARPCQPHAKVLYLNRVSLFIF